MIQGKDIVAVWTSDGRNNNAVWCETSDKQYYKIKAGELLKALQTVDTFNTKLARKHTYLEISNEDVKHNPGFSSIDTEELDSACEVMFGHSDWEFVADTDKYITIKFNVEDTREEAR